MILGLSEIIIYNSIVSPKQRLIFSVTHNTQFRIMQVKNKGI